MCSPQCGNWGDCIDVAHVEIKWPVFFQLMETSGTDFVSDAGQNHAPVSPLHLAVSVCAFVLCWYTSGIWRKLPCPPPWCRPTMATVLPWRFCCRPCWRWTPAAQRAAPPSAWPAPGATRSVFLCCCTTAPHPWPGTMPTRRQPFTLQVGGASVLAHTKARTQ